MPEISLKEQCLLKKIEVDFSSGQVLFFFILLSLILFQSNDTAAQKSTLKTSVPDSILEKQHSPTKATIMSTCLPGLGQVYNKKYWKVPIIYAGLGIMAYFIVSNSQEYSKYKGAYIASVNNDTTGKYQDLIKKYSAQDLLSAQDYYRRNLEISCLLTGVWYILNIVDAAVDAHLFTFNINKDLSLKVDPVFMGHAMSRNFTSGIRLSLRF